MDTHLHLTEIAGVILAALGCGLLFEKLKQPAVLGYILAGLLLGPACIGIVPEGDFITALADLGVLMLLFLVGLELCLPSFKRMWVVCVMTTLAQLTLSLGVTFLLSMAFPMSMGMQLVVGFSVALSSTAVAVKMLESVDELHTETGRLTIGILIAQDLAVIPMILILSNMHSLNALPEMFVKIGMALALLGGVVWVLSRREPFKLPFESLVDGHQDLLPLLALIFCFGAAALSGLMGLSAPYGAFIGGLLLGNTSQQAKMVKVTRPIQAVLLMVFFFSIGLMLDPQYIWAHLMKILILLVSITLGKTFVNVFILHLFKQPWRRAFLSGLVLSQVGEFGFMMTTVGVSAGALHVDDRALLVSLTALSLALSPLWLSAAHRLHEKASNTTNLSTLVEMVYAPETRFFVLIYRRLRAVVQWCVKYLRKAKHDA